MEDVDSAPTAPTSTNQDADPAHCEPALDRKSGKVLDNTHRKVLDKTHSRQPQGCRKPSSFLSLLVVSRQKILKLRLVDTTNVYFV